MTTLLKSCVVPWDVSPSMSGVTLRHSETDTAPECTVIFGANALRASQMEDWIVEVTFHVAWFARAAPKDDNDGIESVGYQLTDKFTGASEHYLDWRRQRWLETGVCPKAHLYIATSSDWLSAVQAPGNYQQLKHYVVSGRDGYVEVLAKSYRWRAWKWTNGDRDEVIAASQPFLVADGVE